MHFSPCLTVLLSVGTTFMGADGSESTWEIQVVREPHALTLDAQNSILYSTNYDRRDEQIQKQISIIDVSIPSQETLIGEVEAPVAPADIRIVAGYLFAIGYDRSRLYATNTGVEWIDIPISPTGFESGTHKVLFPWRNGLLVLHEQRRILDFVDLESLQLSWSTDLPGSFLRISLAGDYLVLLSRGLREPVCSSLGPMVWIYTLPKMQLVSNFDVHGDCPEDVATDEQNIFIVYRNEIRRYRPETTEWVGQLATGELNTHSLLTDRGLVVESADVAQGGRVFLVDRELRATCVDVPLLQQPQHIWPAVAQLAASEDGRVFIANMNDDAVSVWVGSTPCPVP